MGRRCCRRFAADAQTGAGLEAAPCHASEAEPLHSCPCRRARRGMLALMAEVWRIPTPTGALFVEPPRERAIAALAEAQHTVVSLEQFEALHLGASGVRARVSAGRLRRIHRGVYAVGPGRLGGCGEWMAAVLACGPSAVLSHRSAAALWGLRADRRDRADVSVPGPGGRSRPGIQIHRSSTLRSQTPPSTKVFRSPPSPVHCSTSPRPSTNGVSSERSSRQRCSACSTAAP